MTKYPSLPAEIVGQAERVGLNLLIEYSSSYCLIPRTAKNWTWGIATANFLIPGEIQIMTAHGLPKDMRQFLYNPRIEREEFVTFVNPYVPYENLVKLLSRLEQIAEEESIDPKLAGTALAVAKESVLMQEENSRVGLEYKEPYSLRECLQLVNWRNLDDIELYVEMLSWDLSLEEILSLSSELSVSYLSDLYRP